METTNPTRMAQPHPVLKNESKCPQRILSTMNVPARMVRIADVNMNLIMPGASAAITGR